MKNPRTTTTIDRFKIFKKIVGSMVVKLVRHRSNENSKNNSKNNKDGYRLPGLWQFYIDTQGMEEVD